MVAHARESLDQNAASLSLLLRLKRRPGSRLEHLPHALLALSGTFQVRERVDFVRHRLPLVRSHGLLFHLHEFASRHFVRAQVFLVSDEDDRHVGTEVSHLGRPLLRDVLEAVRAVDGEAHEDDVRVWVGQRTEAVIVLLSGCVP